MKQACRSTTLQRPGDDALGQKRACKLALTICKPLYARRCLRRTSLRHCNSRITWASMTTQLPSILQSKSRIQASCNTLILAGLIIRQASSDGIHLACTMTSSVILYGVRDELMDCCPTEIIYTVLGTLSKEPTVCWPPNHEPKVEKRSPK